MSILFLGLPEKRKKRLIALVKTPEVGSSICTHQLNLPRGKVTLPYTPSQSNYIIVFNNEQRGNLNIYIDFKVLGFHLEYLTKMTVGLRFKFKISILVSF
jgi:hypothetical protein